MPARPGVRHWARRNCNDLLARPRPPGVRLNIVRPAEYDHEQPGRVLALAAGGTNGARCRSSPRNFRPALPRRYKLDIVDL